MANEHIPKLLRAIAKGTDAKERQHDIIFNVAADEIERLRKTLAASCDEQRQMLYESGPTGGCERALRAEAENERLRQALLAIREKANFTANGAAWASGIAVLALAGTEDWK